MLTFKVLAAATAAALVAGGQGMALAAAPNLTDITTVVVIYAENRSFDNLYGFYPGADGLHNAKLNQTQQLDRDGSILTGLPAVWGGTSSGVTAGAPTAPTPVTQSQSASYLNTFNHPYDVEALYASVAGSADPTPLGYTNRDLYHRFYENQMQINGGANNKFAAWADSGGMTMGYFVRDPQRLPLWNWAQKYVLADHFFQAAFGGSYLNHQFLICACTPIYPDDGTSPKNPASGGTSPLPSVLASGSTYTLKTTGSSPASALSGPPAYVASTVVAASKPFYTINTMQPPYAPSGNAIGAQASVNLLSASTVPPQQKATTIGDLLTNAGVNWAYYSGAWNFALSHVPFAAGTSNANPNFQYHHQPFNYYTRFDPARPAGQDGLGNTSTDARYAASGAAERAAHLKDAGVATPTDVASQTLPSSQFLTDIQNGTLPAVTFYKPHGTVNEHAGYANIADGDQHIAAVLSALQASPQWGHMLIVVTYDENGGWWDHAAPPKGDAFGPGSRIPALIISPYARKGFVDHTQYDTTSILHFITRRWGLPVLDGITVRDNALVANGFPAIGDLTNALVLP